MAAAVASEERMHRRARALRRLAARNGIGALYCAGDGILVADLDASVPHFTVAQFCAAASGVLDGPVQLLSSAALAGHRIPDAVAHPHPL